MNKLNLPDLKNKIDQKTILPAALSVVFSSISWYFSYHFASLRLGSTVPTQILLFLFTLMMVFVTFDRLTNKSSLRVLLPLIGITLAIVVVLLLSKELVMAELCLLTLVTLLTTFMNFKDVNAVGLAMFSTSIGVILPVAFFYLSNRFVSGYFLQVCIGLALVLSVAFFDIFITNVKPYHWVLAGLSVITAVFLLFTFHAWAVLVTFVMFIINWFIAQMDLKIGNKLLVSTIIILAFIILISL